MFACAYAAGLADEDRDALAALAYCFSPKVEETSADTVVLDVAGCGRLFGSISNIAARMAQRARESGLEANITIAPNPDAAVHAARAAAKGFNCPAIINPGEESEALGELALEILDPSLAGVDQARAVEILETLELWGIRRFRDFAGLPQTGVAERLGPEGVRMQRLAGGTSRRSLVLEIPEPVFEKSAELDYPIDLIEPLSFILAHLLDRLTASLKARSLATNEVRLRLMLEDHSVNERAIRLPFPTRNHRALLRLLLLDIESRPADGAVVGISVSADPVRPRAIQNGLFTPLTPEPDRFELTVARIARLVGTENVGSAELMDTHRPGAFLMRRMAPEANDGRKTKGRCRKRTNKSVLSAARCLPPIGFRVFRPPLPARVETRRGRPVRIASASSPVARSESSNSNATQGLSRDNKHDRRSITAAKKDPPRRSEKRAAINGEILRAAGPWRTTGDWWSKDGWARDEWDITIGRKTRPDRRRDSQPATSPKTIELVRTALPPRESNNSMEGVYRIYQELASGAWFIEGSYD